MTIWISTGGRPSHSAKALSSLVGFRRHRDGKVLKPGDLLVNWGSSNYIIPFKGQTLNRALVVKNAANKLIAFTEMGLHGVNTVEWTTSREEAQAWADKSVVIVRNKLTGHSGDGILIIEKGGEVPGAPLYTKYIYKVREFRVHVVGESVIDTQQKIRDPKLEPADWKIRSHANGFLYARNGIISSDSRDALALSAVNALGLDFGAVDIVEDKAGNFFVLEVNTAPGLEGQTLENYAKAFMSWPT